MLLAILLIITSVLYVLYSRTINREYTKKLSTIKSDPALPIFGHVFSLGRNKEDLLPVLEKMWRKFGCDKFLLKIGPTQQVVLTKPSDVEVILSNKEEVNKNIYYKSLKDITGDSIVITDAHRWRLVRKIWTPAFHHKCLESYGNIIREEIDELMIILNNQSNDDVNMFPLINKSVLTASCRISLGFDAKTDIRNYVNNIQTMFDITGTKIFSAWKSIDLIFNLTEDGKTFKKCVKLIDEYIESAINAKHDELKSLMDDIKYGRTNIESLMKNDKFNNRDFNFLSHLLLTNANNDFLTNNDIKSEIVTFTLASNETTSITTTFAAYCLALNPKVQEIAYQEQLSISGGNINKPITCQEVNEMKYLECVIKESMRLFPPVMFFGRRLIKDITLPDGVELPAGCNLLFMPFLTHKLVDVFPEPNTCNPDRFLFDNFSQYSYFPFSAGPRNCVGAKLGMMESKLYLASIIRAIELLPPLGERPKLIVDMSLKSSTGVNMRLKRRN